MDKKFGGSGLMKIFLFAGVVLIYLMTGCSNSKIANSQFNKETIPNSYIEVQLETDVEVDSSNTVTIKGKTNLPEDMQLLITIKNSNWYYKRDLVNIKNGTFMSSVFSNNGSGLRGGDYTVEIASPAANTQPLHVNEIIGQNGSNLEGVHIKSDSVLGKIVAVTKKFMIDEKYISNYYTEQEVEHVHKASSYYTKEQLENDPRAPSKNVNDYNSDGEYVPQNGISDNPADYNAKGEYKPVEQMTREEMREELESMFENSLEY